MLNESLTQVDSLPRLYTPVFAMISALEVNQNYGDPGELSTRTEQLLTNIRERLRRRGVNEDHISDAQYAVVAFIDEFIGRSEWHGRTAWQANTLAVKLSMQSNAGVVFFEKLDQWLRSPDPPQGLLMIFHICLGLGFRGKYFDQPAAIQDTKRRVLERLVRGEDPPEYLSPHSERPRDEVIAPEDDDFPWLWLVSACGGVLVILLAILKVMSISQIDSLISLLQKNAF